MCERKNSEILTYNLLQQNQYKIQLMYEIIAQNLKKNESEFDSSEEVEILKMVAKCTFSLTDFQAYVSINICIAVNLK